MPAVQTQQLAFIADIDVGDPRSAMVRSLSMFDSATKNTFLRRASADVLSAYAKRHHRIAGSSFVLAKWGDLTIGLVVDIARYKLIASRGFNPDDGGDVSIKAAHDEAQKILSEIRDITNKDAREDPDVIGMIDADEQGALSASEGGTFDEADGWAQAPGGVGLGRAFG